MDAGLNRTIAVQCIIAIVVIVAFIGLMGISGSFAQWSSFSGGYGYPGGYYTGSPYGGYFGAPYSGFYGAPYGGYLGLGSPYGLYGGYYGYAGSPYGVVPGYGLYGGLYGGYLVQPTDLSRVIWTSPGMGYDPFAGFGVAVDPVAPSFGYPYSDGLYSPLGIPPSSYDQYGPMFMPGVGWINPYQTIPNPFSITGVSMYIPDWGLWPPSTGSYNPFSGPFWPLTYQ